MTSHTLLAEELSGFVAEWQQRPMDEAIKLQARIAVEIGYSLVEMALEDKALPAEQALRQGAAMLEISLSANADAVSP